MAALRTGYSTVQITLHWLIAVLVTAAWFTGDGMGRALRTRLETGATGIEGNTWHVWLGGTVFALILIRIAVRWMQGAPAPTAAGPAWQVAAAVWGHRALYLLMVAVPLMGAATWYGGIPALGDPHAIAANALLVVAGGHAAVALVHHYVWKDETLRRMLRPGR